MKSDTLTKLTECVQEISLLEGTVKKLEASEKVLRDQLSSIEAKISSKTRELKEKHKEIDDLDLIERNLDTKSELLKEEESVIAKEKEASLIRHAKLDKWEQELKAKSERIQRILA